MGRVEKTVFLSYRRADQGWASAIFQNLTSHGFDVFFDFGSLPSGDFERVILENIKSRAHFLVLLTPTALERCGEPDDWLRREVEAALESQRNIVPIALDGFDFATPSVATRLTGRLASLARYNALDVPRGYLEEAMQRLRDRYLNVPLEAVLHPSSAVAREMAEQQLAVALTAIEQGRTFEDWAYGRSSS
jgi:hypothetical protein